MPILRIQKRENPYAQIDKAALEDNRLSWRARGILAYLLSKPDNWHIHVFDIVNHGPEGRDAVQHALKELEQFGYARLETLRNERGHVIGKEWFITEQPTNGFSGDRLSPTNGITDVGKNRLTVNPHYSNNDNSSNNDLSLSVESERAPRKGGKKTTKPAQPAQRDAGGPDYTFADFWNDYGHKVGSKPKTEKAFAKLTAADRDAIRATLEIYKRETVTKDAQRGARDFRPMRQHPLTYLNGRMWETYTDRAGEADAPTPYDADYQKYLDWVKENYPLLLHAAGHFSKTQFVEYKTKTPTEVIGSQSVLAFLKQAHNQGSEAFPVFQTLVQNRLKIRQV